MHILTKDIGVLDILDINYKRNLSTSETLGLW